MTIDSRFSILSSLLSLSLVAACSNGGGGTSTSSSGTSTSGSTSSGTGTTSGTTTGTTTSASTTGTASTGAATTSGTTSGTTGVPSTFVIDTVDQVVPGDPNNPPYDAGVALVSPPTFLASCSGVDAGDLVTLMVEVELFTGDGGGFLNTPNVDAGSVPSDGNPATATLAWLDAGAYQWQVRGITAGGALSDWVPYNNGGFAFLICGAGTCPDNTGYVCAPTDVTTDANNCWACGNGCSNGWCDPNFPDGGSPGTSGVFGCHSPSTITAGLSGPIVSTVDATSRCYYYAESVGLNSMSNGVALAIADWYTLTPPLQIPLGVASDPGGVALAINAAPNDAGVANQVLYFPNDGGCGTGVNAVLDTRTNATYHGIANDGTYVYLTVTTVVGNPDAGMTDDEVWRISISTGTLSPPLFQGGKGLSDIIYNPIANKLFFLSRSNGTTPSQVWSMDPSGTMAMAIVPSASEAFGPTPALAYSPTTGQPTGTLYWTSATGVYSSAGGAEGTKILTGLSAPSGITTYLEGTNRTDAVFVTTGDGSLIEWHRNTSTNDTLATRQAHPDYPLPYVTSCAGACTYEMTWLSEVPAGHGGWLAIDFPN
jgi:hypothetical protein